MNIKFENMSEIQSITSDDVKRGRRAVLYMLEDHMKMKWYQRLWFKIYCLWVDIDNNIKPWKYRRW